MEKKEVFSILMKNLPEIGYEPIRYSGRGMYGRSCLGFLVNTGSTLKVVLEIGSMLEGWGLEVYDLGSLATDSLGMDEVIYFPSVPWSEEG